MQGKSAFYLNWEMVAIVVRGFPNHRICYPVAPDIQVTKIVSRFAPSSFIIIVILLSVLSGALELISLVRHSTDAESEITKPVCTSKPILYKFVKSNNGFKNPYE